MDFPQGTSAVMRTVGQAATETARYLPEPVASGVDFAGKLLSGGSGGVTDAGVATNYQELINKQIETQVELQQVTFLSNIERSQHETRMAAVRNIRVS